MFANPADFSFVDTLTDNWLEIRREFDALSPHVLSPWHDRHLYSGDGWKAFGLYAFGKRLSANCELCPDTTRLVESVPGMQTAGFSRLGSQAHIRPHSGLERGVLRFHLGCGFLPF